MFAFHPGSSQSIAMEAKAVFFFDMVKLLNPNSKYSTVGYRSRSSRFYNL